MSTTSVFVWLGIIVGHTAILINGVNLWYGRALPRQLLAVIRAIHALLVPLVLLAYWWVYSWNIEGAFAWGSPSFLRLFAPAYAAVCMVVAYGFLPIITIVRIARRPSALLQNHTRTIDVAAKLGYKPLGRSKYQWMGRLPGNEIYKVDFAEKTLRLPRLPAALDGLTILHLSDLHFSGTPDRDFYYEAMDVCRAWEPDVVAISGDIVDSDHHHRWILPLLSRLRWRHAAFAILGNHDMWHEPNLVRRRVKRLGIEMLGNSWKCINIRGESIVVIGNEAPWVRPAPDLKGCPAGVFRLCLSHTPDNIHWARQHEIDLVLAGHCHGGQIRLPGFGSVLVPSRFGRRYDCGTFDEGPTVLHVVRGLAAQHPLRYNCRPEIALLVLKRATAAAPDAPFPDGNVGASS
jgi:predicted MPP superfamily phosphohydrolase